MVHNSTALLCTLMYTMVIYRSILYCTICHELHFIVTYFYCSKVQYMILYFLYNISLPYWSSNVLHPRLYCDCTVMYCVSPTIHREIEWPQFFEFSVCLFVLFLLVHCKIFLHFIYWPANFILFYSFQIIKYWMLIQFTPPSITS